MNLRLRLEAEAETVQEMLLAAGQKFEEGFELLVCEKKAAGIYLLGYSAEMYLKTACFFVDSIPPTSDARASLGPLRKKLVGFGISTPHEHYHSLLFFIHYLIERRKELDNPFSEEFKTELLQRIELLYEIWWVEMRYRQDDALSTESLIVLDEAAWIRDNHHLLWS